MLRQLLPLLLLSACAGPLIHEDTNDTESVDDTYSPYPFEEPLLPDGFEASLDARGGCSDTWLQLWDADGTWGLEIYRQGLLARAETDGPVDETLTLGVDEVVVIVQIAEPISVNYCTDALTERTVDAEYTAVSGTLHLTMQPASSDYGPGVAGITLTNVVLQRADGHSVVIDSLSASDIGVVKYWGG